MDECQSRHRESGHCEESAAIKKLIGVVSAGQMARAAVPARYMLERQDWQGAAQLQKKIMEYRGKTGK
jgi:hypothetical protein